MLSFLFLFIPTLHFHFETLFLCLTYFSASCFSLFPFPFFLVSLLSCRCSWPWKMDGPSHALITQTSWCQYSSSVPFVVVIAWLFVSACDLILVFVFCSHSEWFFSLLCSSVPSALSVITAFALIESRKCLLLMLRILCMICLCISLMCWEHWAS